MWFQAESAELQHLLRRVLRPGPLQDDHHPGGAHSRRTTRTGSTEKIADKNKPVDMARAVDPGLGGDHVARDAPALYKTYCVSCHGQDGQGGLVEGARDFTASTAGRTAPRSATSTAPSPRGSRARRCAPSTSPALGPLRPGPPRALLLQGQRPAPGHARGAEGARRDYQLKQIQPPKQGIPVEQAMEIIAEEAQ